MRKFLRVMILASVAVAAFGCTTAGVTIPREAVDIAAKIERTMASDQVTELTDNLDTYLASYTAKYKVKPRRGDTPLKIAEAYLQEYQPGPLPRVFQSTIIYDRNGVRLAEVFGEGQRTWVSLDKISPYLIDAIIATEDSSFYTNQGVDARRVVGAFIQNAEAGDVVSGASTITMQIARQLFFEPDERFEQTMERKVHEALLAQELSELYTKDELLEIYLNMVHFGRLAYGIEAASHTFFAKSAADLTLPEATLLAGTPQMPGGYDLLGNLEDVKGRQRVVLDLMVRHGYLTEDEADAVFAQEPALNYAALERQVIAPHFVNYVEQEMNKRLVGEDIKRAGLRVYTTLDVNLQKYAEDAIKSQVEQLQPVFDLSNASLVALKPGTAEILAMVGSADFNNLDIDGQVNVAIRPRQPGSAIKPILYATAIDDNLISPGTVIWDVPAQYKLSDTDNYRPINYDKQFHGPVTVRMALANSYNIPAVKLLDAVGVERMLEKAREMGIDSLSADASWYGLSLTLGGGEVTLLDLTEAYHTIANGGVQVEPQFILHVVGDLPEGYQNQSNLPGTRVLKESTAYLVTNILSDNETRAIEFGENSPLHLSKPAAAKTGTTNDIRDNWTMGFTRQLVTGVWAGNSDGKPMRNASGITGAAPIWHTFMESVLADEALMQSLQWPVDAAAWEFERPDTVQELRVFCPAGIRCTGTELFSDDWIAQFDKNNPLADSVVGATMSTVYANFGQGSRPIGACSDGDGQSISLLRAPNGLGDYVPWYQEGNRERISNDSEFAKRVNAERSEAVSWSVRNQHSLYLGPCDDADQIARRLFGDRLVSTSVGGYTDSVASLSNEEEEFQQNPQEDPQLVNGQVPMVMEGSAPQLIASASSSYGLLGIAHDGNCGGNAVMGQVSNAAGQPVGGIGVRFQDSAGNVLTTVTGMQNQGFGSFRFALGGNPDTVTIMLTDASGAAISPRASVPHLQGGASDRGCHYVIWQGN